MPTSRGKKPKNHLELLLDFLLEIWIYIEQQSWSRWTKSSLTQAHFWPWTQDDTRTLEKGRTSSESELESEINSSHLWLMKLLHDKTDYFYRNKLFYLFFLLKLKLGGLFKVNSSICKNKNKNLHGRTGCMRLWRRSLMLPACFQNETKNKDISRITSWFDCGSEMIQVKQTNPFVDSIFTY